jgi:hypothetical protein
MTIEGIASRLSKVEAQSAAMYKDWVTSEGQEQEYGSDPEHERRQQRGLQPERVGV